MGSDYEGAGKLLIDSILKGEEKISNREELGSMVPLKLFQSIRLIALGSAMEEMLGAGSRALIYQAGQRLGLHLGEAVLEEAKGDLNAYVALIQDLCLELKIGKLIIDEVDLEQGKLALHLDECVSCAGITGMNAPICNFETGMVGGIIKIFLKKNVRAVETHCHAVGDESCAIQVKVL